MTYIYILSFFKTYETFPVEITRAHAREHLTRAREVREQRQARARDARAKTGAREVCEQGARALRARWSARARGAQIS